VGWLVDRYGIKWFYLLSILLMAGGSLTRAAAHDWRFLVVAATLGSVAARLSGTGCRVISADSVQNEDRVTAQNVCGTLGSLAGMIAPLIAAYLVTLFGGMTVEGIRPLYTIQFIGYGLVFLLVVLQLREPQRERLVAPRTRRGILTDFRRLFEGRQGLGRWIAISALTSLPLAMY
jgi:MFS family permease